VTSAQEHRRQRIFLGAPSSLGLRPPAEGKVPGTFKQPAAFRELGFPRAILAIDAGDVAAPAYRPEIEAASGIRNATAIVTYSKALAAAVGDILDQESFPVVVGGDCSILLGSMLALRRRSSASRRYGLLFVDGHTDYADATSSTTGGAAGMDLALVTGKGSEVLANMEGLLPLVCPENVVAFGFQEPPADSSWSIGKSGIQGITRQMILDSGIETATAVALKCLRRDDLSGFWIHVDADVLSSADMPAVDSPNSGGLALRELTYFLTRAFAHGPIGVQFSIYDPNLDTPDKRFGRPYAKALATTFASLR
jgi:arginase